MADTAAFFANKKKKKKKAFTFNANKIDAASVTTTIHVDAPALSTTEATQPADDVVGSKAAHAGADPKGPSSEQWDDEALAANLTKKVTVAAPGTGNSAELLDMKSLDLKRDEEEDIAEKLRIKETKAKLAAAKEGMEREALRIKEEQEKKEQAKQEAAAVRPNRWVPTHMKAGGSMLSRERLGMASKMSQKIDTQSEELFPDLASASKIIEEQKMQQPAYKVVKKTPVGGGATWGARPKLALAPRKKNKEAETVDADNDAKAADDAEAPAEEQQTPKEEDKAVEEPEAAAAPAPAPAPTPAPEAAPAQTAAPIKPKKKKKKKDLSTFKASS
eukprot:CAMPEP_0119567590 /NCGR_PEP_ID=MMETSP1352-20130426/36356_1 /TAXON_ID=265584 /ORGANISM="Stauroneis constricta, Strain CCMP1120" /LENGTH=331 /DNA_ID=CAMNT_0007616865 /DNA_START=141 /DNA_END=1136 /DNA_ORIENTATION=-